MNFTFYILKIMIFLDNFDFEFQIRPKKKKIVILA